jgi:hypothetical protein
LAGKFFAICIEEAALLTRLSHYLRDSVEGIDTYRYVQKILTIEHFFLPLFRREVAVSYIKDLDTKPRIRGIDMLYGSDVVHWEF